MIREQLFINRIEIPLESSLNPSLNFSIADIAQPDKRKSTYSKTIKIPNSKIASKLFGQAFEINLIDGSFDTSKKADMTYVVGGQTILEGYIRLKSISTTDNVDISYNVVLMGETANLFSRIKGKYLTDIDLSEYDHPLYRIAQVQSWDNQILQNGIFIPFQLGRGYVYPLIDYGYTTNQVNYSPEHLAPAIYAKEYFDRIFDAEGLTYTSTFLNSTLFKSLIIPSDPTMYNLSNADIVAEQFSVNTPLMFDTGTVNSNNLTKEVQSSSLVVRMSADVSDPSGLYNNTTGEFTVGYSGMYNFNAVIDVNTTFTPNSLVVLSEATSGVRGFISIIKNGSQVLDQVDFNMNPNVVSIGVKSTSSTPSNNDPDYYDIINGARINRVQSPPDRYQLNVNAVSLLAGDIITIEYTAGLYLDFGANNYFNVIAGGSLGGDAFITMAVGGFSNTLLNQVVGYGNTVSVNKAIPFKYKQADFLLDIIKMFNLQVEADRGLRNNFIIEPHDDYYLNTTVNNWSEKHAINKPFTLTPTGKLKNLTYSFSYKEDGDYYNKSYLEQWKEVNGYREVTAINDFLKGEYKTALTLSPTPLVGEPNSEIVIPRIISLDDNNVANPTKFNRRILYYGGMKGNPLGGGLLTPWAFYDETANQYINQYTYPYAGNFNDPFNATLDINFGLVKEVYYDNNVAPINVTNNNLYNVYYRNMMDGILDPNGKVFEGMFHLTPDDIYSFSFRDLFYHNNAHWRLMEIKSYNPTSDDLVKCVFQKTRDIKPFVPVIILTEGGDEPIVKSGNIIDDSEKFPVKNKSVFMQSDNNNYNFKTTKVTGQDNYINRTADNIEILGSGNTISANTSGIRLINSDDNFIKAGVTDVTLINSNGLTIEDSGVTIIDGMIQTNEVLTISADTTLDPSIRYYWVDTTLTDVTLTLPQNQTDGQEWTILKLNKEFNVIISAVDLLNGKATRTIKNENTSIDVVYGLDETTYKIK